MSRALLDIDLLGRATTQPHHAFWPCDLSLLDPDTTARTHLHGPRQVSDAYLLALAARHDGRFVTFDQAVPLSAVKGATPAHLFVL